MFDNTLPFAILLASVFVVSNATTKTITNNNTDVLFQYLKYCGYIKEKDFEIFEKTPDNQLVTPVQYSSEILQQAILKYQEVNDINTTPDQVGTLTMETINMMNKPRCGVQDYPYSIEIPSFSEYKWNENSLDWCFINPPNNEAVQTTTYAFKLWERYTSLDFTRTTNKKFCDIVISMGSYRHKNEASSTNCAFDFDGPGLVAGHAYPPNKKNEQIEIYVDWDEEWNYSMKFEGNQRMSLYYVLAHEIGHALGLHHSNKQNPLMYSAYIHPRTNNIDILTREDKKCISYLYSSNNTNNSHATRGTTSIPPIPTTTTTPPSRQPKNPKITTRDICNIKRFDAFLVINTKLYIFSNNYVFTLNIGESMCLSARNLENLPYLPKNFTHINHVYRRPSGTLMVFIDQNYYIFNPTNLNLIKGPVPIQELGLSKDSNINSVFTTYSGKTFIIYDKFYCCELGDNLLQPKQFDDVTKIFPGVPANPSMSFRYTNGMIYFFCGDIFYEYNEFTQRVVRSSVFNHSMLGLACPNVPLHQLKSLLSDVITYNVKINDE